MSDKLTESQPRLAYQVEGAMANCRLDFFRIMQDFDFCAVCPLLLHCIAQDRKMTAPTAKPEVQP